MKAWLKKFRMSAALDSNAAFPDDGAGVEVQKFAKTIRELDQQFRSTRPAVAAPESLHQSIMRAVRNSERKRHVPRRTLAIRWAGGTAVAAALVVTVFFAVNRREPDMHTLAAASDALTQTQQIAQRAPSVVVSPLEREMELLNRDIQNAMEFLAASVP